MNRDKPVHKLIPGQELIIRWRDADGNVRANLEKMKLTLENGGNPQASAMSRT